MLGHNLDKLSTDDEMNDALNRYWWIEQIDNPMLCKKIKQLSPQAIELLTLFVYENYSMTEIAKRFGVSKTMISKRMKKIKQFLK